MIRIACSVVLLFAAITNANAELRTPKVFSDQMVLQRDLAVPVWGWADPNSEVTIEFASQKKTATANELGEWQVKLDKLDANSEGQVLSITAGDQKKTFKDVLVGDVWICSGQSNMEWTVSGSMNPGEEIKNADYPKIRLFDVPGHETAPLPIEELRGNPTWKPCNPSTVGGFSAVGYFFGRKLNQETDVPIGLLGTNWGGTRVEPWTPPIGFRSQPALKQLSESVDSRIPSTDAGKKTWDAYLAGMDAWLAECKEAIAQQRPLPTQPKMPGPTSGGEPTAIYNAMVDPLVPFGVRGAIWYQGESNAGDGMLYLHKLNALISGWRTVWNQGEDFPFYFYVVQLANFTNPNDNPEGGDGFARVRFAQSEILKTPHTGLACIIDIGDARDIHPRNKQDVGKRLARWALRDVHGQADAVVSGPIFKSMKVDGKEARISFDHVGGGLMVGRKSGLAPAVEDQDTPLKRFAIAGKDNQWHWADARIEGDQVVLSSDQVPQPVAVRYAYSGNPEGANLYNKEGLPAVPFRTDEINP